MSAVPASPCLLVLDSAGDRLCVGLTTPDGRRLARDEPGGARSSARLLPAAQELLQEAALDWPALDGIAFGRGPGAFTGLRTACAVAQGLGFGLDRPVLALDSLMALAEAARLRQAAGEDFACWAAVDARMDEIYAAAYRFRRGQWQVASAPALYAVDALAARWQASPPRSATGNALAAFDGRLPAVPAPIEADALRVPALLSLALQRWPLGEAGPAAEALPLYLRDKVALTTAEREAQRAAVAGAR